MNEENKNLNEAENTESANTAETAENAEAAETAENTEVLSANENTADEPVKADGELNETKPETADEAVAEEKTPKKPSKGMIIGIVVLIVVVAAAIVCKVYGSKLFNKYNRMGYINTSGATIDEVADRMGMSLDEFLEAYDLPKDMPGNTEEAAAYYTMPFSKIAEQYGADVDTLKQEFELGDEVTDSTTWGEAEGLIKVGLYVGEENLDAFKEYYGLGDDVTADTLWKDVRDRVDAKNKADNDEQKKKAEEAEKATEAPADEETSAPEDSATEAPADASTATEAPAQQ